MNKVNVHVVKVGALQIRVREYSDERFGFDVKESGKRLQIRRTTMREAIAAAAERLNNGSGNLHAAGIDHKLMHEFLQWNAQRTKVALIPDLVRDFLNSKESKGRSEQHLRNLRGDLNHFAKAFPGSIRDLPRAEVEQWLDIPYKGEKVIGNRRWNNKLTYIIALHNFARRDRLLPAEKTPVELIERRKVTVTVSTYTPHELQNILKAVQARREKTNADWLPCIVLGAFCGIRPEESAPWSSKPGLRWENILWDKGKIDVPAETSKTGRRRFVTLCEAAKHWLQPYKLKTGFIAPPKGRFTDQIPAWVKLSQVKWKQDALRHSYASYRLALESDMAALALEMGNSPGMIHRHYLDLKHEDEARQWFGIRKVTKVTKKPKKHPRIVKALKVKKRCFTEVRRKSSFI